MNLERTIGQLFNQLIIKLFRYFRRLGRLPGWWNGWNRFRRGLRRLNRHRPIHHPRAFGPVTGEIGKTKAGEEKYRRQRAGTPAQKICGTAGAK